MIILINYFFSELLSCYPVTDKSQQKSTKPGKEFLYYIELLLTANPKSGNHSNARRPKVRCQNDDMANKASRHVNS